MRVTEAPTIKSWSDIPGFFRWVDRWVFATLLEAQQDSPLGTLVELGTYQAKSAVIIGSFVRPGERFVALDLFGREDLLDATESGLRNRQENRAQYKNLTREQFEHNYLALHDTLPQVHEGLSNDIVDLVEPRSARFVHVDAGHMYDQVRQDVINTKTILRPGGIAAFDDYRTEWTPGVAAAVWQAVFEDGLVPVAITPQKMYGIYEGDDPEPYREALKAFVKGDPSKWWMQEQHVLGRPLLRIKHVAAPAAAVPPKRKPSAAKGKARAASIGKVADPAPKSSKPSTPGTPSRKPQPQPKRRSKGRTRAPKPLPRRAASWLIRNVAPPALTRWVRRHRSPWPH